MVGLSFFGVALGAFYRAVWFIVCWRPWLTAGVLVGLWFGFALGMRVALPIQAQPRAQVPLLERPSSRSAAISVRPRSPRAFE